MRRLKEIIYDTLIHTWGNPQGRHPFRVLSPCAKRLFQSSSFDIGTKEGGRVFKFLRNPTNHFAVFFRFPLPNVETLKSHLMIERCKHKPRIFAPFRIVHPLGTYSLSPMTNLKTTMNDKFRNCATVNTPQGAKVAKTAEFTDISQFYGIPDIHTFDGFHSFYGFLRQTFFHTRYVLITGKSTKKESMLVYNLSVNKDESYVIPAGIVHNCRCTVVQVRRGKYPESDEREAMNLGSQATACKHQEMMRFNPGKQMACFPAYNPYTISRCKDCEYRPGKLELAKVPDNELCAACKVIREMVKARESLQEQRKAVREWAKENLAGKTVLVQGVPNPVEFTMNGIKETLNQPHKYVRAKNEALRDIVALLQKGEHVLEKVDDKGNPMVNKYHYIHIDIAKEPSFAVIRELMDGRCQFYSIVEKLKKKGSD